MAATRIRKTFHYPDSDDEETVEAGLDAQGTYPLIQSKELGARSGVSKSREVSSINPQHVCDQLERLEAAILFVS